MWTVLVFDMVVFLEVLWNIMYIQYYMNIVIIQYHSIFQSNVTIRYCQYCTLLTLYHKCNDCCSFWLYYFSHWTSFFRFYCVFLSFMCFRLVTLCHFYVHTLLILCCNLFILKHTYFIVYHYHCTVFIISNAHNLYSASVHLFAYFNK